MKWSSFLEKCQYKLPPGVDVGVCDGRPVLLPSGLNGIVVVIVEHHLEELRLGQFPVLIRVRL